MSLYWLQTRAPAGNWVDNLGSNSKLEAIKHGLFLQKRGRVVRVVMRHDRVVWRTGQEE